MNREIKIRMLHQAPTSKILISIMTIWHQISLFRDIIQLCITDGGITDFNVEAFFVGIKIFHIKSKPNIFRSKPKIKLLLLYHAIGRRVQAVQITAMVIHFELVNGKILLLRIGAIGKDNSQRRKEK